MDSRIFVPTTHPPITVTKLRQSLARVLPDYMIPAVFVSIDALPQTPNGKTDRLRLPLPGRDRPALENPLVLPRTEMESDLSAIWAEVLGLDQVGVQDNFFELGGNSLLATQIIARVVQRLKVNIPLRHLLESPTVASMAEYALLARAEGNDAGALSRILQEIELLSDEEIDNRLADENK